MDTPNTVNELMEMQKHEVEDTSNNIMDALDSLCDSMAMTKAVALFAVRRLRDEHCEMAVKHIKGPKEDRGAALYWSDDAGRLSMCYESILNVTVENFPAPNESDD